VELILKAIVAAREASVERARAATPLEAVRRAAAAAPPARPLAACLRTPGKVTVIAEIKRASPVKGILREEFDPVALARAYTWGGAAAISVITEEDFFRGSPAFLPAVREATPLPLLRKDFLFDPYQIYESRALGADAVLLIAAILDQAQLAGLLALTRELGMEALVEVHTAAELRRALAAGARLIGINNRDLRSFRTDLNTTLELRGHIPDPEVTVVSESGIRAPEDLRRLAAAGVHAALIGEALVRAPNPEARLRELVEGGFPP